MKDFKLTLKSLLELIPLLTKLLQDSGKTYRISCKEWRESRSLSQNALFHKWMLELSEYARATDKNAPCEKMYKKIMKHTFLGYENNSNWDAVTNVTTEVSELRHTSDLDAGEMYHFMCLVDSWCVSIGLMLTIPDGSDYKKLKENENGNETS